MSATRWRRSLWGVALISAADRRPHLLGAIWHDQLVEGYPGEPSRALLFLNRREARAWCQAKRVQYADRSDSCATWRFRPVRVVESVTVMR